MNKKIVGIFVMTLLLTTGFLSVIAEDIRDNFNGYEVIMFTQEPDTPENEPMSFKAEIDDVWRPYDDFWGLTNPISEVHWWSTPGKNHLNKIIPADPEGSVFTIIFCEDDGTGKPGDIVCTYENVTPTITGTGIMYEYYSVPEMQGIFELYYYEAVLDPYCDLADGWISIVKTDSIQDCLGSIIMSKDGNNISWSYNVNTHDWWSGEGFDMSLVLVGYIPDLTCDGTLNWLEAKPGDTYTGNITVENIGGPCTLLDWQIETDINWGDWTFSPETGEDLKPEDGPVMVNVTVIAPDEKNSEFTGEIYLVNKNNPEDKCTVTVTLTTSKIKTINNLLFRLLGNHPLIYQLIRQFFKL